MKKIIKLTKFQGIAINAKIVGLSKKIFDKMSDADKKTYIDSHLPKVQPEKRARNDYGIPYARGCAFPSSANPFERNKKRTVAITSLNMKDNFKLSIEGGGTLTYDQLLTIISKLSDKSTKCVPFRGLNYRKRLNHATK